MNHKIENEIVRTLGWLGETGNIQVSPLFVDTVSSKTGRLQVRRANAYRSRAFYPVVVLLLVGLNLAALMGCFTKPRSAGDQSYDQVAIVAGEYGIGQSSYTAF